jgi:hypothetical protein
LPHPKFSDERREFFEFAPFVTHAPQTLGRRRVFKKKFERGLVATV